MGVVPGACFFASLLEAPGGTGVDGGKDNEVIVHRSDDARIMIPLTASPTK
jgi:hypothetical protein